MIYYIIMEPELSTTFILTNDVRSKMAKTGKSFEMDVFKILKDDIRNYRRLTSYQIIQIEYLTDQPKIEIIKLYDTIIISIQSFIE